MPVATIDLAKSEIRNRIRDLIDYSTAQGSPQEAAEAVFDLMNGYLRGRLPEPFPDDLVAVGMSAALRYSDLLSENKTVKVTGRIRSQPVACGCSRAGCCTNA